MKDKKLQVFVSSTFTDLKDERQAAVEAILSSGNIPAGMELFSAGDESQMTVIKRWIEESDVYLLILGGRYGSIEKNSGKSYTHLEYEYALSLNKPLFAVVINDEALDKKIRREGREVIEQENQKELKAFRDLVLQKLVKFYDDRKDIKLAIHETLSEFAYSKELTGWIRGDNSVNTARLAEEIARLTKENSELRNQASNTNTALYNGLTYDALKGLLEKEECQIDGDYKNMFEYLVANGNMFVNETGVFGEKIEHLRVLFTLKVLRLIETTTRLGPLPFTQHKKVFTDEGHNFYLKALSLRK